MSEQSETSENSKAAKVKDPRKVELGKRLAKISREAKERKARQRSEAETEAVNQREITDYIDFKYFIGGVGLVVALGGLYCSYKKDKREIREEKEIVNKLEHSEKEKINNVKEENSRASDRMEFSVKQASASDKFKKCAAQGFENFD